MRQTSLFLVCLLLYSLFGCAPSWSKRSDEELKTFLADLKKRTEQHASAKAGRLNEGIRKFSVEKSGADFRISVDLVDASLPAILERLFNETSAPHVFQRESVTGKVTAMFDNLSLIESLKVLLSPLDSSVSSENGVIIIRSLLETATIEKPAADKGTMAQKASSEKQPDILLEVFCYNADVSKILKSLEDFYPKNPTSPATSPVKFSVVPNSNSILLSGSPMEVRKAAGIIRKADRKPRHILIEASVVEVDTSALWELGIDISGAATGEFKNISASFGSLTGTALTFSWAKQTNPVALTAAIDFLVSKGKAHIITRPYLATLSGEKATINITNDRYVVVTTGTGDVTTSTPIPIASGAVLVITPKVISDDTVLMDITVEDSGFVTPPQNVAVEVDKNKASTIMQVDSGGTIIIGGLILDRQSKEHSGVPLLSEIPLLNILFGKQKDLKESREVMIFITPHIWQPGISSPVMTKEKSLINVK